MQKSGVDHVISDMCMFLCREIFNAQGRFFDKNGTLAEFSQLYNYKIFGLWTVISIDVLGKTWILMTDVVNIVFLTDVVNKLFDYWIYRCCECELWILVMLCEYSYECLVYITVNSKFKKYTYFIANSNNIFNLYRI